MFVAVDLSACKRRESPVDGGGPGVRGDAITARHPAAADPRDVGRGERRRRRRRRRHRAASVRVPRLLARPLPRRRLGGVVVRRRRRQPAVQRGQRIRCRHRRRDRGRAPPHPHAGRLRTPSGTAARRCRRPAVLLGRDGPVRGRVASRRPARRRLPAARQRPARLPLLGELPALRPLAARAHRAVAAPVQLRLARPRRLLGDERQRATRPLQGPRLLSVLRADADRAARAHVRVLAPAPVSRRHLRPDVVRRRRPPPAAPRALRLPQVLPLQTDGARTPPQQRDAAGRVAGERGCFINLRMLRHRKILRFQWLLIRL